MAETLTEFEAASRKVERALFSLRSLQGELEDARAEVRRTEVAVSNARIAFSKARKDFLEAFPEVGLELDPPPGGLPDA